MTDTRKLPSPYRGAFRSLMCATRRDIDAYLYEEYDVHLGPMLSVLRDAGWSDVAIAQCWFAMLFHWYTDYEYGWAEMRDAWFYWHGMSDDTEESWSSLGAVLMMWSRLRMGVERPPLRYDLT